MPAKRLYRSRHDQIIGGVCAGLADYFEVDPVLVRLAAAGVTLFGFPLTILGYIVCWIVIPEQPRSAAAGPGPSPPPRAGESQSVPPSASPGAGAEAEVSMGLDAPVGVDLSGQTAPPAGHAVGGPPHSSDHSGDTGATANPGRTGGCILIGIGLFFLMINLDLFDWDDLQFWRWRFFVPAILIGFGLWLFVRALLPSRDPGREG